MSGKKQTRKEMLEAEFPNVQINKLISFTRKCPLTFHEKLVYSFLFVRCKRKGQHIPASISKISRLSGMHRTTVAKALERLKAKIIVEERGDGWILKMAGKTLQLPNPEWYGWRGRYRDSSELAYHYFPLPAHKSPLSVIDSLIFIADRGPRIMSAACLAGRFGIHRRSVARSRKKLKVMEYTLEWFMKQQYKKRPQQPRSDRELLSSIVDPFERPIAQMMINGVVRWPEEDICDFFETARARYRKPDEYTAFMLKLVGEAGGERKNIFKEAMEAHSRSGKKGSGYGLLKHQLGWGKE